MTVRCDVILEETGLPCGVEYTDDRPGREQQRINLHRRNKHGLDGINKGDPMDATAPDASSESVFGPPPVEGTGEVPPAPAAGNRSAGVEPPRRRGIFSRRKAQPADGAPSRRTSERAPKPSRSAGGRRVSAADTFADLWGFGGAYLARSGHAPTGRMLAFQAPVAGEILDDAVKGTVIDKAVVQKIVGARGRFDAVFAIVGPPALAWQMEKAMQAGDEGRFRMLEGMLKSSIKSALPTMVPAMRKVRQRESAAQEAMADLLDEAELAAMGLRLEGGKPVDASGTVVDVGDVFVAMLFAEWEAPPAPPPPADEPTHEETADHGRNPAG